MSAAAKQILRSSLRTTTTASITSTFLRAHRPITFSAPSVLATRPRSPSPTTVVSSSFHTSAARMTVHEFKTASDFETAVKDNAVVIVDCTAAWCGPCKMISPVFDKLSEAEENEKVYFAKFDVDEIPELAAKLGIRAMPTFKVFQGSETPVEEMMGANPPVLMNLVKKYNA